MADQLPRPGVQVIQQIASTTPTLLQPTLVPLIAGVCKEVIEVTTADGLVNSAAKQGTYSQLPKVVSQTSFPSPRGNISEVDVEEATVKAFLLLNGTLREFDRSPGSSFLFGLPNSEIVRPFIEFVQTNSGYASLGGKVLVLAFDVPVSTNTLKDVVVKFVASGALSAADVADQINTAVGDDVAVAVNKGGGFYAVRLISTKYGAAASVTVRRGGSANATFGFGDSSYETRIEGAGFRAQNLNNGRVVSPWIEWFSGEYYEDGVAVTVPDGTNLRGFVDLDGNVISAGHVADSRAFNSSSDIDLKVGDEFYVDGQKPNGSAVVMKVEATRFKLGTIDPVLSSFDSDGKVTNAVYTESLVSNLLAASPLAPKYAWFKAKNLTTKNTPTAATSTGTVAASVATAATVNSPAYIDVTSPVALAGLQLTFTVTVDGVEHDSETFTFSGGPFSTIADIVDAFNNGTGALSDVVASEHSNSISFSTVKTGALQALTLNSGSSAMTHLGFSNANYSATGSDQLVRTQAVAAAVGSVTGGTSITFPFVSTNGQTLEFTGIHIDGVLQKDETFTFTGTTYNTIGDLVSALNTALINIDVSNNSNKLIFRTFSAGSGAGFTLSGASSGLTAAGFSAGNHVVVGTAATYTNLTGTTLRFLLNNRPKVYSVTFANNSLVEAVAAINHEAGTLVASISSSLYLTMTSPLAGYASRVVVKRETGGDQASADLFGFGSNSVDVVVNGSGRPLPDFYLDAYGNAVFGAEAIRNVISGRPLDPGSSDLFIQYTGVRKDVSALATTPALLTFSETKTLSSLMGPINTKNPLGLGTYLAMVNAPTVQVSCLGVDAASASEPYGTLEAYTRLFGFLESKEVYAIAPLTNAEEVVQVAKNHVLAMSAPSNKGERVLIANVPVPTRANDTLLASGLDGRTNGSSNQFVMDASPIEGLASAGLDPDNLTVANNVFIQITVNGELRRYSVSALSPDGHVASLRTSFTSTQNTDGFFTTTTLDDTLVNEDWSIAIRGAKLLLPGSTLPDLEGIAETVAAKAKAYKTRRMLYTFPDTIESMVNGVKTKLPMFYGCAAIAGMTAGQPPQQGFTNFPMAGFTGVTGSNDQFKSSHLDVMAAGGVYILMQDAPGAPVMCRHQLTTDVTSIETREYSITRCLDMTAKFMRSGFRLFLGVFNITQVFIDTLSTVGHGMVDYLKNSGVLEKGQFTSLVQDANAPDSIQATVTCKPPYPCNYITITLIV